MPDYSFTYVNKDNKYCKFVLTAFVATWIVSEADCTQCGKIIHPKKSHLSVSYMFVRHKKLYFNNKEHYFRFCYDCACNINVHKIKIRSKYKEKVLEQFSNAFHYYKEYIAEQTLINL